MGKIVPLPHRNRNETENGTCYAEGELVNEKC
ncbi:hypothetical protein SAMN05444422_109110 [Halobiforma haloterrestris]|uniref:Uncharacterized protein n=1 Tax=Natronobacterium haloterrestre TaxID=148448 RepID=A0A1I1JNJ3_NATHA|nr:hypothetical protein SAMN05444422_109110 [Halobiforma haloterrestris]